MGPPGERESEQGLQMTIICGDHMFAKVYGGNRYDLIDLTGDNNTFNWCNGPVASTQSAELILERNGAAGPNEGVFNGADTTFHGVGVTDTPLLGSPTYKSMCDAQHDYENTVENGEYVSTTGPCRYDPGGPPYNQYTLTWISPCGNFAECG